jgi:hypothetical protein
MWPSRNCVVFTCNSEHNDGCKGDYRTKIPRNSFLRVTISPHVVLGFTYRLFLHCTCSRRYSRSISSAVNVGDDGQADAIGPVRVDQRLSRERHAAFTSKPLRPRRRLHNFAPAAFDSSFLFVPNLIRGTNMHNSYRGGSVNDEASTFICVITSQQHPLSIRRLEKLASSGTPPRSVAARVAAEVAAQLLKHTCKMDQGRMCRYMTMHPTNPVLLTPFEEEWYRWRLAAHCTRVCRTIKNSRLLDHWEGADPRAFSWRANHAQLGSCSCIMAYVLTFLRQPGMSSLAPVLRDVYVAMGSLPVLATGYLTRHTPTTLGPASSVELLKTS